MILEMGVMDLRLWTKVSVTQKSPPPFILLEPESNSVFWTRKHSSCRKLLWIIFPSDPAVFFLFTSSWSPDIFLKVEIAALFTLTVDFIQVITRDSEGGNAFDSENWDWWLRLIFITHQKIGVGQVLISATNAATFLSEWPSVLQFALSRNWGWGGWLFFSPETFFTFAEASSCTGTNVSALVVISCIPVKIRLQLWQHWDRIVINT